jgi:hypothetical protein
MARSSKGQSNGQSSTKNKPVFSKRYWTGSGNIEVAVWENSNGEGDDERIVLSTTLRKTFKSDGEYEESKSLFPQELPLAALALQEAAAFCFNEQNKK